MNALETDSVATESLGETLRKILKPVASLQLTVGLFAASLVLVFFGTLAQKNAGIWQIVDQYFWSWYVMIDTQLFVQFLQVFLGLSPDTRLSIPIPFPGAKLIGGLMFINLLAAHAIRFKLSWKRAGIIILHAGILLLFVGEFVTRGFSVEQQMRITEGTTANFTIDTRSYELAIIDSSNPKTDRVMVVPATRLRAGARIELPEGPFDLKVAAFHPNAEIKDISTASGEKPALTSNGIGRMYYAKEIPVVSGVETDDSRIDNPTARIEIVRKGSDEVQASYLLPWIYDKGQPFDIDGKTYQLTLRFKHSYKPYSIFLNDFRFDRYLGTNIPKNYSSNIRLLDPEHGVDNTTTIAMNEPMRYRGETFYQSGVLPGESGTVLQVVENPGWLIPYVSCGIVTFGMLLHFGIHLRDYLRRMFAQRSRTHSVATSRLERWLPWGVLTTTIFLTILAAMPHGKPGRKGLDLDRLARIPVVEGGRVKPLDTVARVDLRRLNHKEFYTSPDEQKTRSALDWWLSVASSTPSATKSEVFRIESDQVLNLLGLTRRDGLRYSIGEFSRKLNALAAADGKARAKPKDKHDLFDEKILDFTDKVMTYQAIQTGSGRLLIAPADGSAWRTYGSAQLAARVRIMESLKVAGFDIQDDMDIEEYLGKLAPAERDRFHAVKLAAKAEALAADPGYASWEKLFSAYRSGNEQSFNEAITELEKHADVGLNSGELVRVRLETFLNDTSLYFWCIGLYVLAILLTVGSWACFTLNVGLGHAVRRSAILVLVFTFAIHTFTLFARMYLMDRPLVFVTNLYSTAVFIGWAAVGISLLIERLIPITLGCLVASVLGFLTTILAHNLAASGDTLEMMRAVLDTNFWLATHVTTINLGYSATYMAGLIGIAYLVLGIFTPHLKTVVEINGTKQELGRLVGQLLYGAIAGATVLSFIGTVLGGIWGDQSWGRFWGWDPKENGALMIVIWNAMILHARWAGLVKDRGIAVLALGGNMITTWSYFGTNQLGVGLHAYGFSNTLAAVCVWMWTINLVLIGMSLLPKKYWRSYQDSQP